jgi:hypothetical protein
MENMFLGTNSQEGIPKKPFREEVVMKRTIALRKRILFMRPEEISNASSQLS